jgi:DNA polymerase I-like protein with 3'-5' exonuclease and polymerase domains
MRTSINVGATETGRFSSSKSTTGTGANMFNITEELRGMFVADPGYKLCGIDLEQAESREVGSIIGRLFDDWTYLDACEAGDLHTTVAKMVWKDRAWTGKPVEDRKLAEVKFYRHFSYRDISKRLGHANNYLMTPWTGSRLLKIPLKLAESFQDDYLEAFPGIPRWHRWVAEQLQTTQQLTTAFERQRHFFGRPNDDATLREAVAYEPQSTTADRLNIGLLRMWNHFGPRIQVLLQLYDAVYFQFREDDNESEIISEALQLIDVPMDINGRKFTVPGEAKTGWNWKSFGSDNPDGLKKYKGEDTRKRTTVLERIL